MEVSQHKHFRRDLRICQKRNTNMSKETNIHFLLRTCTAVVAVGQHKLVKRDLPICQKRPTNMSKETYKYVKRDIHLRCITHTYGFGCGQVTQTCPKGLANMSKETCNMKRGLCSRLISIGFFGHMCRSLLTYLSVSFDVFVDSFTFYRANIRLWWRSGDTNMSKETYKFFFGVFSILRFAV